MVRKKSAPEVSGNKLVEDLEQESYVATSTEADADEILLVLDNAAEQEVVLEQPKIRSDAETVPILLKLLMEAPGIPCFNEMKEVTSWIDKTYRPWINKARLEAPL